jgi:hypothetical protein
MADAPQSVRCLKAYPGDAERSPDTGCRQGSLS